MRRRTKGNKVVERKAALWQQQHLWKKAGFGIVRKIRSDRLKDSYAFTPPLAIDPKLTHKTRLILPIDHHLRNGHFTRPPTRETAG